MIPLGFSSSSIELRTLCWKVFDGDGDDEDVDDKLLYPVFSTKYCNTHVKSRTCISYLLVLVVKIRSDSTSCSIVRYVPVRYDYFLMADGALHSNTVRTVVRYSYLLQIVR